jgi:hypothetical protein
VLECLLLAGQRIALMFQPKRRSGLGEHDPELVLIDCGHKPLIRSITLAGTKP